MHARARTTKEWQFYESHFFRLFPDIGKFTKAENLMKYPALSYFIKNNNKSFSRSTQKGTLSTFFFSFMSKLILIQSITYLCVSAENVAPSKEYSSPHRLPLPLLILILSLSMTQNIIVFASADSSHQFFHWCVFGFRMDEFSSILTWWNAVRVHSPFHPRWPLRATWKYAGKFW